MVITVICLCLALMTSLSYILIKMLPSSPLIIRMQCSWKGKATSFRQLRIGAGDFIVASRLSLPMAVFLTVLYYGQYWVLRKIAFGNKPEPFFSLGRSDSQAGFFFLFLFALAFAAYRLPFTKGLTAIKEFLIRRASTNSDSPRHILKHAMSHLGRDTTSLIFCIAIFTLLVGQGIEGFFERTQEHLPIEVIHAVLFLIPIALTIIANRLRRDSVSEGEAHASLINAFFAVSIIIFLSCRFWSYSIALINEHSANLAPGLYDLLRIILVHDLLVFGLVATLAILPFTHFVGHPKINWMASLILYSAMVVLVSVAWLVTQAGDQAYLVRVQNPNSTYYQEFPNLWQKNYVEGWIVGREYILLGMILLAILYGIQELWIHPWRSLQLRKLNHHLPTFEDAHMLKESIERIAERRRWFVVVKIRNSKHPYVFVKTTKFRLSYFLKRISKDTELVSFAHPLLISSDVGTLIVKEHHVEWSIPTKKNIDKH